MKEIRIDDEHVGKLEHLARTNGKTEADIVHEALDCYFEAHPENGDLGETPYEAFKRSGLISSIEGLPKDLGSNPEKYMEGFGRD